MRGITLSNATSSVANPAKAATLADCMAALGDLASSTIVIVPSYAQQRFAVAAWAASQGAGKPPMVMPMATFAGHLADAVLGSDRPVVADVEAQLLLDATARRHGERPASIGFSVRTLHRFEQEGIDVWSLRDRPEFDDQQSSAAARLQVLDTLWTAYRAEIDPRGYDTGTRLSASLDALRDGALSSMYLRDASTPVANLILRDVVALSALEFDLVVALADQGWDVAIHWAREPAWHVEEGTHAYMQMRYAVHDVRLHDRAQEQHVQLIGRGWEHIEEAPSPSMPRAVIRPCGGPAMEIRTALATIKTAVLRHGIPLQRIAMIVPDLPRYEHAIRMMARTMGVPLTGGERVDLLTTGPVAALLTACEVITGGWRRVDLDRLRRCNIGQRAGAAVHEIVVAGQHRRITGGEGPSMWASTLVGHQRMLEGRAEQADEDAAASIRIITAARQAVDECIPILQISNERMSAAEAVATLERVIQGLQLDDVAVALQARAEARYRPSTDVEALQALRDALDRYSHIMADPSMGTATFAEHLQALRPMLSATSVRMRDIRLEGVSLLRPLDARGRVFDLVLSLGWVEGSLPSVPRYDTVDHDLLPYARQHDELDMAVDVVRSVCPEHGRLVVTWPQHIGDAEMMPSQFCAMLDACTRPDPADPLFTVDASAAMLSVDEYRMQSTQPTVLPADQRGYDGSRATPQSAEATKRHLQRALSPTRLVDFIDCPYKYAASRLLGLRKDSLNDDVLTPLERGDLSHAIVADFFRALRLRQYGQIDESDLAIALQHPIDLTHHSFDVLTTFLRESAERVIDDAGMSHTHRFAEQRMLLGTETTSGLLHRWLAMEYAQARSGAPKPAAFEMAIRETITVGDADVMVDLRIDRIDVADGNPLSLVVIDYKQSKTSIPSAAVVRDGVKPQMPFYVLALNAACAARGIAAVTASAQYMPFGKKLHDADSAYRVAVLADADQPLGATKIGSNMNLADDLQTACETIGQTIQRLRVGSFPVRPRKNVCDYCAYNELCRVKSLRAAPEQV